MIVQLKMCTVGKIFGKSCLKAIRDIAYFWWGWYPTEREVQNFGHEGESSQSLPAECACSAYCNNFEKSDKKYFLSKQ